MARFGSFGNFAYEEIDLSVLTQPTLIMWGRDDALIPVDMAVRFKAALPNSEVVIYDKVGHIPMEEIPEISARDARTFLQSI